MIDRDSSGATGKITVNPDNQRHPGSDILVLGGTGLALKLTRALLARGYSAIYSIAGLVRQPNLPCQVITGGFSQFGGMAEYIRSQNIGLVIDATHPYAAQISAKATLAAASCDIACWRLQHPPWQAAAGDNWFEFANFADLLPALSAYERVFLSQGRLSTKQLQQLAGHRKLGQQCYLRTAVSAEWDLPDWVQPISAIGPFDYNDELALFQRLNIDVLVSKNSGGGMTVAKLQAAHELGVPVLFLQRPELPAVTRAFTGVNDILTNLVLY